MPFPDPRGFARTDQAADDAVGDQQFGVADGEREPVAEGALGCFREGLGNSGRGRLVGVGRTRTDDRHSGTGRASRVRRTVVAS